MEALFRTILIEIEIQNENTTFVSLSAATVVGPYLNDSRRIANLL